MLEVEARLETTRREFDELVPWDSRCPRCDEQRMDWLVWVSIEGDKVECQTCKATYTP